MQVQLDRGRPSRPSIRYSLFCPVEIYLPPHRPIPRGLFLGWWALAPSPRKICLSILNLWIFVLPLSLSQSHCDRGRFTRGGIVCWSVEAITEYLLLEVFLMGGRRHPCVDTQPIPNKPRTAPPLPLLIR